MEISKAILPGIAFLHVKNDEQTDWRTGLFDTRSLSPCHYKRTAESFGVLTADLIGRKDPLTSNLSRSHLPWHHVPRDDALELFPNLGKELLQFHAVQEGINTTLDPYYK